MIEQIKTELRKYASPGHAELLQRFFKTGPGEYGEGDIFLGCRVPAIRKTASKFATAPLKDLTLLIKSHFHEERLLALIILTLQYKKAEAVTRENIAKFYLDHRKWINNWDLVDLSAPNILGPYFIDKDRTLLYDFAASGNLWEKRIAVLTTFYFIRRGDFSTTLEIVEILLEDGQDLINKACGWMLKEVGKRDPEAEEEFLRIYYKTMPRTMLRCALEKFPPEKKQAYLKNKI